MAQLTGIDHVHVYVPERERAAAWFRDVLGFEVVDSLKAWATPTGPLTIGDASGAVHLALFERKDFVPSTGIAFGTDARSFVEWKEHLESRDILERCTDHDMAWSLYFRDPFGNMYEITTYDHEAVSAALKT